ncbi:MAG TPA: radical SAM protein [Deltaproteobacteria bacterium]|mgnify:CR=1 FL=1|nr:radical SAM protein [Deltaproteobacteria bacterium]
MNAPYILAWELTRSCNLNCLHCRASATGEKPPGELSTKEGFALLENAADSGTKMVILSGGEPLMREDVFEIARFGTSAGLRMTMAVNGSLITPDIAEKMKDCGIARVSVSLDGVTEEVHDSFRGFEGAFSMALSGIAILREHSVPFQINTTIAAMNVSQTNAFPAFIKSLGAVAWHVFFLVPTGRGESLEAASMKEYREMLDTFYEVYRQAEIECKATCAPQFYRLLAEKGDEVKTKGCLAGTGFGFVSSTGDVQPCGFLQIPCGNIREKPLSEIWSESKTLIQLRDPSLLRGKCSSCLYKSICGGCRARAYEVLGDFMKVDPICWYKY